MLAAARPAWNADGTGGSMSRPEVWVHDLESGQSHKIIEDAYCRAGWRARPLHAH